MRNRALRLGNSRAVDSIDHLVHRGLQRRIEGRRVGDDDLRPGNSRCTQGNEPLMRTLGDRVSADEAQKVQQGNIVCCVDQPNELQACKRGLRRARIADNERPDGPWIAARLHLLPFACQPRL